MKRISIVLPLIFLTFHISAIHVAIIESQTSAFWAFQDTIWKHNAEVLGYTAEVLPQSTLDDINNLSDADILVVASGIGNFLSPSHLTTVTDFVLSGRSAYIQSEYLTTYQGNITFQAVMDALSADFAWTAAISGQLVPMNISGGLASTPNTVTTLDYFNYGYAGAGEDVVPFLEFQGNSFGFCYTDENDMYGTVITTSDEDWAWNNASPLLMQNILYKLAQGFVGVNDTTFKSSVNLYPNPFSESAIMTFEPAIATGQILIFNEVGQEIYRVQNFTGNNYSLYRNDLAPGLYHAQISQGDRRIVKSFVICE